MTGSRSSQIRTDTQIGQGRLAAIDGLRGLAILAMAAYHFSWDLSWFAFVDWKVASGPAWRIFAACIAGSFLFLSGMSLCLAHGNAIRWRAFGRRETILVVAAGSVSAITYMTFGDAFVRFGILHCMAAGSLLALPFLRLHWLLSLFAAFAAFTLPWAARFPSLDGDLWLWTGLGIPNTGSVDYVPILPWTGLILLGIGFAKSLAHTRVWSAIAGLTLSSIPGRLLVVLGRKSLLIYLVHQPILYGTVFLAAALFGAPDRSAVEFIDSCTASCSGTFGDATACEAACRCSQNHMAESGVWQAIVDDPQNPDLRDHLNNEYAQCLREHPPQAPGSGN